MGILQIGLMIGSFIFSQNVFANADCSKRMIGDIQVSGQGFFQVSLSDGSLGYTRSQTLFIDCEGRFINHDGYALSPAIVGLNLETAARIINSRGEILRWDNLEQDLSTHHYEGTLQVFTFTDSTSLTPIGGTYFRANAASGSASLASKVGKRGGSSGVRFHDPVIMWND